MANPTVDEQMELEEFIEEEEEPRSRPWGAILSVVLAFLVLVVGYQWHQASAREQDIRLELQTLRQEAETLRLQAVEVQQQLEVFKRQVATLGQEKAGLEKRLVAAEERASKALAAAATQRKAPPARRR